MVFFSDPVSVDLLFGEKSQSTCLDDSNKPMSTINKPATKIVSNFTFILIEFYPSILKVNWLFITTYKADHSYCDYNQRCLNIGLYYF